jgi:hypothetical protein
MKRLLLILLFLPCAALADDVLMNWDAPSGPVRTYELEFEASNAGVILASETVPVQFDSVSYTYTLDTPPLETPYFARARIRWVRDTDGQVSPWTAWQDVSFTVIDGSLPAMITNFTIQVVQ